MCFSVSRVSALQEVVQANCGAVGSTWRGALLRIEVCDFVQYTHEADEIIRASTLIQRVVKGLTQLDQSAEYFCPLVSELLKL